MSIGSVTMTQAQRDDLIADARIGITTAEAAAKYGVSRSTVFRVVNEAGLGFIRRRYADGPDDSEIVEAILSGMTVPAIVLALHTSKERIARVRRTIPRAVKMRPAEANETKPRRPKGPPLYDTCSKKHALVGPNKAGENGDQCRICKIRNKYQSPAHEGVREAFIADIETQVAEAVAELVADLRPEMEKAA